MTGHMPNILVVDDELPVCKSIVSALADNDYSVEMALSGEEALKKGTATDYDIIIADLMMPGISGMELLKKVKEINPRISVIIVTGYPSIKTAVQAIKLGAFDYIPKPFTPKELRSLVARALAMRSTEDRERTTPVSGSRFDELVIPSGLYCIPNNSWLKIEQNDSVRVGAHHKLLQAITEIVSIELPEINAMRYQGEACIIINDTQQHLHRLWTPVSGRIIAINEVVLHDYSVLANDPYGEGWLLMMTPSNLGNELKSLTTLSSAH